MIRIYVAITSEQATKKNCWKKQNIEISSIDSCANYEPISTKFSENFNLAEE